MIIIDFTDLKRDTVEGGHDDTIIASKNNGLFQSHFYVHSLILIPNVPILQMMNQFSKN